MEIDSRKMFCNNIRFLRKKYNLTKIEMAKRCGTTTYNIRLLEKEILPPRLSANILFNIYGAFGIPQKDMLDKLYLT